MKTIITLAIASLLMMVAAPVWSATAVAVYKCAQADSASEDDVDAIASKWLKAAKGVKGGENLEVFTMYPLAATMGETDFMFVVQAPSVAEWGMFMDNYKGATLAKEDNELAKVAFCADSALWQSVKIQ
jgi:hypothetical protein